ncbi:MAG: hypothetical protein D3922_00960 [Candidatus Electrothrix sp. AR1]|nr:hypothetical protein [Candidatus Electrothrix sp. AR1]
MRTPTKEFYSLLEDISWIHPDMYWDWYAGGNNVKKEKLISAIDNEKINFSIKQGYRDFPQNVLIYYCRDYGQGQLSEYKKKDYRRRELISEYVSQGDRDITGELMLEGKSFLAWLKENYPLEETKQMKPAETTEEKTSDLSLTEILNLLTPEIYPDGLTGQEKSAITKSVQTLKEQLPGAFELCCSLVMEAMPCADREEHLKYTRDDVVKQAKERGIKRPIAQQIHKGLPAVMKK